MNDIIVTVITSVLTLAGVCISAWTSGRKTESAITSELDKAQALTQAKVDELAREVREHNNFARRMPVVEEQIKVINHRISDLEQLTAQ